MKKDRDSLNEPTRGEGLTPLPQQHPEENIDSEWAVRAAEEIFRTAEEKHEYEEAYRLLRHAVRQGEPKAYYYLAVLLERGWGCEAEPFEARALYECAAEYEIFEAQFKLATMLECGEGGYPDLEEAHRYYTAALSTNYDRAMDRIADLCGLEGPSVPSLQDAMRAIRRDAVARNPEAIFNLGLLHLRGLGKKGWEQGRRYIAHAAHLGYPAAQFYLAISLFRRNGDISDEDLAQVRHLLSKSSEGGELDATVALAMFNLIGWGADRDIPTAITLLKKAAEANHAAARSHLITIYRSTDFGYYDPDEAERLEKLAEEKADPREEKS